MLVRRADDTEIIAAAAAIGVTLYNFRPCGRGFRFQLHTAGRPPRYGRRGVWENRDGSRRRVPGAVCWHGHRDFLRALFDVAPGAIVLTALARYDGADDFARKYPDTYEHNAGSQFRPASYRSLCDCEEEEERRRSWTLDSTRFARIEEPATTPEETAVEAEAPDGVDGERWSDYNRKFNDLIAGRA